MPEMIKGCCTSAITKPAVIKHSCTSTIVKCCRIPAITIYNCVPVITKCNCLLSTKYVAVYLHITKYSCTFAITKCRRILAMVNSSELRSPAMPLEAAL